MPRIDEPLTLGYAPRPARRPWSRLAVGSFVVAILNWVCPFMAGTTGASINGSARPWRSWLSADAQLMFAAATLIASACAVLTFFRRSYRRRGVALAWVALALSAAKMGLASSP